MSFDPYVLRIEVEAEFQRLNPNPWDRIEDAVFKIIQERYEGWIHHARWWRKTRAGKAYAAKYRRERSARDREVVLAVRACSGCGEPTALTLDHQRRGRTTVVCSNECKGAARANIKRITIGEATHTLTEWCALRKLPMKTVHARIKRGWDVARALNTPLAFRGQESRAA